MKSNDGDEINLVDVGAEEIDDSQYTIDFSKYFKDKLDRNYDDKMKRIFSDVYQAMVDLGKKTD